MNICDICHINEGIGVASIHGPCSVMFCRECAQRGADPEWLFEFWKNEEQMTPDDLAAPDHMVTFKDGKYMTYREWYNYKGENNGEATSKRIESPKAETSR